MAGDGRRGALAGRSRAPRRSSIPSTTRRDSLVTAQVCVSPAEIEAMPSGSCCHWGPRPARGGRWRSGRLRPDGSAQPQHGGLVVPNLAQSSGPIPWPICRPRRSRRRAATEGWRDRFGILAAPVGAWRSLVAHLNGVQEVERSNRSAPTRNPGAKWPLGVCLRGHLVALYHPPYHLSPLRASRGCRRDAPRRERTWRV